MITERREKDTPFRSAAATYEQIGRALSSQRRFAKKITKHISGTAKIIITTVQCTYCIGLNIRQLWPNERRA